jgi:uncharacterized protein (DUF58 family)
MIAMAYGNNLVFIVCFALTCMGMTLARAVNNNMDAIQILSVDAAHLFAENDQKIQVTLINQSKNSIKEIEISVKQKKVNLQNPLQMGAKQTVVFDVPWNIQNRGYVKIPTIIVSSKYPSGLFNAWKIFKSSNKTLVYPARKGQTHFPNHVSAQQESLGLIREIRDYKPGDSPKRIHWRSLAKNQQLRTLVHEGDDGRKCELNLKDLNHLNFEDQLSQLSLWLHLAETHSYDWKLILGNKIHDSKVDPHIYYQAMNDLALMADKK